MAAILIRFATVLSQGIALRTWELVPIQVIALFSVLGIAALIVVLVVHGSRIAPVLAWSPAARDYGRRRRALERGALAILATDDSL